MEVTHIHAMFTFTDITQEKNCLLCYVKSSVLNSTSVGVCSLWTEFEHVFCSMKLVSGFVPFLSACTGSHQEVLRSLGGWRSAAGCSRNVIVNVWEISLDFCSQIWHYGVQCSREMCMVRFHPDYISKGNVSIIQLVLPPFSILWC